jgi:Ser/Thr protein kinase RdoA (MazF antagonist)
VTKPDQARVHGLGKELVEPDWPVLTDRELGSVAWHFGLPGPLSILWHSPRPLSAAALVSTGAGTVFVKRHPGRVRSVAGLVEEHAFIGHLRDRGCPVVEVLVAPNGSTAWSNDRWTYEVHRHGGGIDLYRDALSWTPFSHTGHALAAGRCLARLHLAAEGYSADRRRAQPLVSSFTVFADRDPTRALQRYVSGRPGLGDALRTRPWEADLNRVHLPLHERLAGWLDGLTALWTHNDWHGSNLLWEVPRSGGPGDAEVAGVLDFGLADRTTAVFDLATALERNTIEWLELGSDRPVGVHLDHTRALIEGYVSVRPLSPAEAGALPALLPLVHAEFALSEVEYFHSIVGSASSTDAAYDYFVGHAEWFTRPPGADYLSYLRGIL